MGNLLHLTKSELNELAKEYYREIISLSTKLEWAQRHPYTTLDGGLTRFGFDSVFVRQAANRFLKKYPDCKAEQLISILSCRPKFSSRMEIDLIAIILGYIGDPSAVKILVKLLKREKRAGILLNLLVC